MATTIAYILKSWVDSINQVAGLKAIYSPDISIPEVPHRIRKLHIRMDQGSPMLSGGEPLILFSRRVLKPAEGLGRIHRVKGSIPGPDNLDIDIRKAILSVIPLDCIFISKDWKKFEEFEVNYLLEEGVSKITQFDVDYGDPLGKIAYSVRWGALDDLQISVNDLDSKGLLFSCEITGFVISDVIEIGKAIKEIDMFINNYMTRATMEEVQLIG